VIIPSEEPTELLEAAGDLLPYSGLVLSLATTVSDLKGYKAENVGLEVAGGERR
jgi:hypothetical protein